MTIMFFGAMTNFCMAELKTVSVDFIWYDEGVSSASGYKIYCGTTTGGPYTGIDITGGNPLDIPVGNISDTNNISYTVYMTLDTETERNVFCIIKSYDSEAAESSASNEISLMPKVVSTTLADTSSMDIQGVRDGKISTAGYASPVSAITDYSFGEPVIIKVGYFTSSYKEFVIIGKTTHTVWIVSTSTTSATSFQEKEEWLSGTDVNMTNVDDIIPLNFNGEDETGSNRNKYDIAIIDYINGQVKIFLNTGFAFDSTPVPDGGFGTFTGGAFQRALAGDFTGNGYDDLALYAPSTRNVVVWKSNGTTVVDRSVWCQGGSADALPYAIDYNGDGYTDIMFFNFIGGAFSAFASDGSASFTHEAVRFFTANAFNYALVDNFDIFNGSKREFGIHAKDSTGNFVVFEYDPVDENDIDPFKSKSIWVNTTDTLH